MKWKLASLAVAALWTGTISADPRKPVDNAEVIERLPRILLFDAGRKSPKSPNVISVKEATRLANQRIAAYRVESDPRHLGFAQASLQRWWHDALAPSETIIARATIKQSLHDFHGALDDLNYVLTRDGKDVNALLLRATILQVQGNYDEARATAARLLPLASRPIAIGALASIASLNGEANKSYDLLNSTLNQARNLSVDQKVWLHTALAEICVRLGNASAARGHFDSALTLSPSDTYSLAAFSDFLLDLQDARRAFDLVRDSDRIDNLLLRRALALRVLSPDSTQLSRDIAELKARFAAAKLRGDFMHQREESRFLLSLLDRPDEALALARENWLVQREPADARLYLEAAIAANKPLAAREVKEWMETTRIEDIKLAAFASKIR
jgi:tetratricopeptide (TPR) repeat protein